MRRFTNVTVPLFMILFLGSGFTLAQDYENFNEQANIIRLRKIAREYQGITLTFETRAGLLVQGRLLEASGEYYHLKRGGTSTWLPFAEVIKISREPGSPEAILSLGSAVLGSAFLSGALIIYSGDTGKIEIGLAALLGLLGGGYWGLSTFYESEVIYVE